MTAALIFVWLLPRNLCVLVLQLYRTVISPLYGDVCRYYPSCSAYALGAIQRHGVVKGVWLGVLRILRCHPWAPGGIDDVPLQYPKGRSISGIHGVANSREYRMTRLGLVLPPPAGKAPGTSARFSVRVLASIQRFDAVPTQRKG